LGQHADFVSSVENVQLQRGVGTNQWCGAFGAKFGVWMP
jgi:hypothetical protein